MIPFNSIPFLKILIIYVLGIITAVVFDVNTISILLFFVLFVITVCLFFLHIKKSQLQYVFKWLFLILFAGFIFYVAIVSCYFFKEKNYTQHCSNYINGKNQCFIASIIDIPVVTDKYQKATIELEFIRLNNKWEKTSGKSIVYIKLPVNKPYRLGNSYVIYSPITSLQNNKNPFEFNYKKHLELQNINSCVFINEAQVFSIISVFNFYALKNLGLAIKNKIVYILKNANLSQEAFSICAALLVGYDDEIKNDVMQSFAHSGTLHILSVSGMHTGFVYQFIIWIFILIERKKKMPIIKCVSIIFALCCFALITGLSPAVLRATIMLSLFIVAKTINKFHNSYNILFLSAFLILIFYPFLILNVGFILSYTAVFGLIYFYPILTNRICFNNYWLQKVWQFSAISIAATLTTWPITLYFFNQFPIWFVVSNLIIIPLSAILMFVSTIIIFCFKIVCIKSLCALVLNYITNLMLACSNLTNNSSYGYVDYIPFNTVDVCFGFLLIFMLAYVIFNKTWKAFFYFGSICIVYLTFSTYIQLKEFSKSELVVFYCKHKSAYLIRSNNIVYLSADNLSLTEFDKIIKPYLLSISNLKLQKLQSQTCVIKNQSIKQINKLNNILNNETYIIVSHNCYFNFNDINSNKTKLIFDTSNSYGYLEKIKKQCKKRGVEYLDIKESFAQIILL